MKKSFGLGEIPTFVERMESVYTNTNESLQRREAAALAAEVAGLLVAYMLTTPISPGSSEESFVRRATRLLGNFETHQKSLETWRYILSDTQRSRFWAEHSLPW